MRAPVAARRARRATRSSIARGSPAPAVAASRTTTRPSTVCGTPTRHAVELRERARLGRPVERSRAPAAAARAASRATSPGSQVASIRIRSGQSLAGAQHLADHLLAARERHERRLDREPALGHRRVEQLGLVARRTCAGSGSARGGGGRGRCRTRRCASTTRGRAQRTRRLYVVFTRAVRSMTGFGRGVAEHGGVRATVDIRAVNHRFLDLKLRGAPLAPATEEAARRADPRGARARRGHRRRSTSTRRDRAAAVRIDAAPPRAALRRARAARDARSASRRPISRSCSRSPAWSPADDDATSARRRRAVLAALDAALAQLAAMRASRGRGARARARRAARRARPARAPRSRSSPRRSPSRPQRRLHDRARASCVDDASRRSIPRASPRRSRCSPTAPTSPRSWCGSARTSSRRARWSPATGRERPPARLPGPGDRPRAQHDRQQVAASPRSPPRSSTPRRCSRRCASRSRTSSEIDLRDMRWSRERPRSPRHRVVAVGRRQDHADAPPARRVRPAASSSRCRTRRGRCAPARSTAATTGSSRPRVRARWSSAASSPSTRSCFDNRYGTAQAPIDAALAAGRDVIFDVDWQGGAALSDALARRLAQDLHPAARSRRRSRRGCARARPMLRR